jgi:thioesterase domain-containing protein
VREAVVVVREDEPGNKCLVAYAVLSQEGAMIAASELRAFLKKKLPEYMLPSAFVLKEALPLTPNGKVDRRSLPAPDSHLSLETTSVPPRSHMEMQLVQIWENVLNVYPVGVRDCFFERGGHSLLAVRLMTLIQQQFGKYLPLASLFQNSTIEHQASLLLQQTDSQPFSPLVAIQPAGSQPPFFCVHPVGGNVLCYFDLARHLGKEQPFYGLQSPGLNGEQEPKTSIEDMAAHYIEALQAIQPSGPYYLGGWSLGGIVAFEMAQQLHFRGEKVAFLALIDSYTPAAINWYEEMNEASLLVHLARDMGGLFGKELPLSVDELQQFPPEEQLNYILKRAKTLNILPPEVSLEQMHHLMRVFQANREAMLSYIPQPYPGKIALFSASEKPLQVKLDPTQGWDELATHGLLDIQPIPGEHYAILRAPHVQLLAQQLATNLKAEN